MTGAGQGASLLAERLRQKGAGHKAAKRND